MSKADVVVGELPAGRPIRMRPRSIVKGKESPTIGVNPNSLVDIVDARYEDTL